MTTIKQMVMILYGVFSLYIYIQTLSSDDDRLTTHEKEGKPTIAMDRRAQHFDLGSLPYLSVYRKKRFTELKMMEKIDKNGTKYTQDCVDQTIHLPDILLCEVIHQSF